MTTEKQIEFMIGQRVIIDGINGTKEIGVVVPSETGVTNGVWVKSPSRGYASDYTKHNVKPLPNGQL